MKENPRYKNFTTLTKERFFQFRKVDFRQENPVVFVGLTLISIILTVITVILFCRKGLSVWILLNAIIIIASLWLLLYGYKFMAQKEYERLQVIRGENPDITYEFYEEYLQMETARSKVRINYSQVDKLMVTDELYILKVGSTGIIINMDGFMAGNAKKFKEFIESRINIIR